MSLILDALRKSEAERRRGNLPALALELPPPAPRTTRPRAWWLAFPVAVAVGVVVFWLTRPDGTPAPVVQATPETPARPMPPLEARAVERTVDVHPVDARSTEVLTEPASPAPSAPVPAPRVETAPAPDPAIQAAPSAPTLMLADLTPDERRALPPLKLSMHMWSELTADRFVILDGDRLGEGDRAGSAVVERIDPDGVILAADGRRIHLPLP